MVYKMNPEYDERDERLEAALNLQRQVKKRCRERMIDYTPVVTSSKGEVATVQLSWDTFMRILIDADYFD